MYRMSDELRIAKSNSLRLVCGRPSSWFPRSGPSSISRWHIDRHLHRSRSSRMRMVLSVCFMPGSGRRQSIRAFQKLCGPKVVGHLARQHVANLPLKGTLICFCLGLEAVDDAIVQVAYGQVAHSEPPAGCDDARIMLAKCSRLRKPGSLHACPVCSLVVRV